MNALPQTLCIRKYIDAEEDLHKTNVHFSVVWINHSFDKLFKKQNQKKSETRKWRRRTLK